MAEVGFYHLTEAPLEAVLPVMLERALSRGWRAEVRGCDPAAQRRLDAHLWVWRDAAFLPHGLWDEPYPDRQPVLLTVAGGGGGSDRAGPRDALFLVGGATLEPDEAAALTRTALLFDGHDSDAVSSARGQWRAVTAAGLTATYWAQEPDGRWTRKATSGTAG